MNNKMEPLVVSASALVNACGAGREATLGAIESEKSGLRQGEYPNLDFDTWIGCIDGIESHPVEDTLSQYSCRNNRIANLALSVDGFRDRVSKALEKYGANRIGVFVGTSTSGIEETEKAYWQALTNIGGVPYQYDFMSTHNMASLLKYVQKSLGLAGPGQSISTACSSSAKVFATAHRHIMTGLCDAAVVGGVDSLCLTTLYGFNSLQLISDEICRPYDVSRKGINIGEAGGFVLLEKDDQREKTVRFKGYGESSDAYHMSSPQPDGDGAVLAMQYALQRAGLIAGDIDYINLHGTATPSNDASEGAGLARLFDEGLVCSSTKGYTGHTLGAAGITEAIISIMALEHGVVPGNLNLKEHDNTIHVRPVRNTRTAPLNNVISNSFGFGGSNCSLVFGW